MTKSRHERLTELFARVGDLPSAEREAFLDRECAGDAQLRSELEALLKLDRGAPAGQATELLAGPAKRAAEEIVDRTETLTGRPASAEAVAVPKIEGYKILRRIGTGGAGHVFEAYDERMERHVALKVLAGAARFSDKVGLRFDQEAWIAGKLNHPGIVKVYERGTAEDTRYFTMELADGGSLDGVITRMRSDGRDERLGMEFGNRDYMEWAIRQVIRAARALDYAHRNRIVHRDIKPMNLLLITDPPAVKIADFGIALDEESTRLTTEGRALGTLRYMAPEQLSGSSDAIDLRTDIYSLGVTLFELLTLDHPYRGNTYERYMRAVMTEPPLRPSKLNDRVSRDLEVVIGKAMEKDPRDRYATAGQFADDLENVLSFRPTQAKPPGAVTRVGKWIRRKPVHAALIALLLVGIPAITIVGHRAVRQAARLRDARVLAYIDEIRAADAKLSLREVIALCEKTLALAPNNGTALQSRAAAYFNLSRRAGDSAEGMELRRLAIEDADRWIAADPQRAGPRRLKARFLRAFGEAGQAAELDREADSLDSGDESDLFYSAHTALFVEQDPAKAEELLDRLLLIRPRRDATMMRARAREEQGNFEGALDDYRYLISLNANDHRLRLKIAAVLEELEDWDRAESHLQRALELAPGDPDVHEQLSVLSLNLGLDHVDQGDSDSARSLFRQSETYARDGLAIDDDAPRLHLGLGLSLVEQSRLGRSDVADEAVRHYARARELAQGADDIWADGVLSDAAVNECDLLIQVGRLDRALEACRRVTEMWPDDPDGYYNLAAIHALSGRPQEAFEALELDLDRGDTAFLTLQQDEWFESLRDDPRFLDILSRMRAKALSE